MKRIQRQKEYLGTPIVITVVIVEEPAEAAQEARAEWAINRAFEECARIEKAYSRFIESNELALLNRHVGEWTLVSAELFKLIAFGERVKKRTKGAFDLTVKSILEGWGYDAGYSLKEGKRGKCGTIELRKDSKTGLKEVRLGAEIDLGGLGKGYALDRMKACLRDFPNFCLNAGGDLVARGEDENRKPWRIVFEHPTDPTQAIGYVDTKGLALAASSPSRRIWRNRHHLVHPHTGEPANEMGAVYTQAESALLADAYSTALFVLGYKEAQRLLPTLPVEALLISPEGRIYQSPGFQGRLFSRGQ